MPFKFLTLEVADRVATLTVNRPDKLNALNDATIAELGHAIDEIRVDDAIGGVILTGAGRALQLLMTGEMIDAAEAYRIGLVNKVVAADQVVPQAREMLKMILANGPLAVALCIEAIDRGLEMSLDEGLILEANHFGLLAATDDMREGMRAFLDKRAPAFKGR